MREYVCVCVVIIGEPARSGDAGPEVPYDGPFSTVKAMGARHLKRRAVLEGTPLTLRAVLVGLNGPRSENGGKGLAADNVQRRPLVETEPRLRHLERRNPQRLRAIIADGPHRQCPFCLPPYDGRCGKGGACVT